MEKQFKYIYKGNEVSKEEFTNVAKEMFKWFDNNTINAVDYSSVSDFLDGDYKSKEEINKHLKGVLSGYDSQKWDIAKSDFSLEDKIKKFYLLNLSDWKKEHTQLIEECLVNLPEGNKKEAEMYLKGQTIPELKKMLVLFKEGHCIIFESPATNTTKQKFVEAGEKAGEKHNKIFLQSYNNLKGGEISEAYKETEGKLFYELDWGFITQMAERMASNKKESKYNLWNWKKPMTPKGIEDLKQATLRHLLAIMDGVYEDDSREFGHIEAVSAGMMMINYQLKNNLK